MALNRQLPCSTVSKILISKQVGYKKFMKRKERDLQWSKEPDPRRNGVDRSRIQSSGERQVLLGSWELASVAVCNAFE